MVRDDGAPVPPAALLVANGMMNLALTELLLAFLFCLFVATILLVDSAHCRMALLTWICSLVLGSAASLTVFVPDGKRFCCRRHYCSSPGNARHVLLSPQV